MLIFGKDWVMRLPTDATTTESHNCVRANWQTIGSNPIEIEQETSSEVNLVSQQPADFTQPELTTKPSFNTGEPTVGFSSMLQILDSDNQFVDNVCQKGVVSQLWS